MDETGALGLVLIALGIIGLQAAIACIALLSGV